MNNNFYFNTVQKLKKNSLVISIIGLGYVGLPLALLFGKKFKTFGIDTSKKKIEKLNKNIDINNQCSLKNFKDSQHVEFKNNYEKVKNSDVVIVCLPTPVDSKKKPDLSIIKNATTSIAKNLKKNSIIIYESTFSPGTVEEVCSKILEKKSKLKWKEDFFLGYSPERVNPNDKIHTIENINKLVSGDNNKTLLLVQKLYKKVIKKKVVKCQNIKVAETAKVLENIQRDINIALMNELSIICLKLNISSKQVIDAASTKWNFVKFTPGLVGGHCIGVDPYYLKDKSIKLGYYPKIISCGRDLNDSMPKFIFDTITSKIQLSHNILFIGITFKENCNDVRNSKNIELIKLFIKARYKLDIYDPILSREDNFLINRKKVITNRVKLKNKYDAIIILVPHQNVIKDIEFYIKKIKKNGFIFDIKSRIDKKFLINNNFNYWSL